jgi:hypothetical protein
MEVDPRDQGPVHVPNGLRCHGEAIRQPTSSPRSQVVSALVLLVIIAAREPESGRALNTVSDAGSELRIRSRIRNRNRSTWWDQVGRGASTVPRPDERGRLDVTRRPAAWC